MEQVMNGLVVIVVLPIFITKTQGILNFV